MTLPYPSGTGKDTHNFRVVHMFTVTSTRLGTTAGNTETPAVTKTDSGLQVTLEWAFPRGHRLGQDRNAVLRRFHHPCGHSHPGSLGQHHLVHLPVLRAIITGPPRTQATAATTAAIWNPPSSCPSTAT